MHLRDLPVQHPGHPAGSAPWQPTEDRKAFGAVCVLEGTRSCGVTMALAVFFFRFFLRPAAASHAACAIFLKLALSGILIQGNGAAGF